MGICVRGVGGGISLCRVGAELYVHLAEVVPWFITGVGTGSGVLKLLLDVALTCVSISPVWKARDLWMLIRGSENVWSLVLETAGCIGDTPVGVKIPQVEV